MLHKYRSWMSIIQASAFPQPSCSKGAQTQSLGDPEDRGKLEQNIDISKKASTKYQSKFLFLKLLLFVALLSISFNLIYFCNIF